ncbi:unnamed protein product [Parajaminaea phylloscopi]
MILSRAAPPANPFPSANNPFSPASAAESSPQDLSAATPPDFAALLAQAFSAPPQGSAGNGNPESFVSSSQLHPENGFGEANRQEAVGSADTGEDRGGGATARASGSSSANTVNVSRQVPAFLNKLRSMVDDKQTDTLICWATDGRTFVVPNNVRFAKEVLPRFFKHNNFSSFVRQLNMYGFHKVPSLQQGSLKHEQEMELWEFENENFVRDHPELMANMQRKRGHKGGDREEEDANRSAMVDGKVEEGLNSVSGALMRTGPAGQESESLMQLSNVWQAIQAIQSAQTSINDNLRHLHLSNDRLWQEAMEQKQRSDKQSETINRMLRFLAGVFSGQDVLANGGRNGEDGTDGTPSKGKKRGSGAAGQAGTGGRNGAPGPGNLFRSPSSKGRLLIEAADAGRMDGSGNEDASPAGEGSGERIQELFSRFSEAGNTPPGSTSHSPLRPSSPTRSSPAGRFSQLPSPPTGTGAGAGGVAPPSRPALLAETPRRPSTPGKPRATPNQIIQALASGEGQAFLQQLLAGGAGAGGAQGKLDPGVLAALQGALAAFQGASNGNAGDVGFPSPALSDSSRFIYPYTNSASPNGDVFARDQNQNQNVGPIGASQGSGPLSQPLLQMDQSAEMLQNAIHQLASVCGTDATNGDQAGGAGQVDMGYGGFPAGTLPSGTTPAPSSAMTPGDWNHYAAVTPSSFQPHSVGGMGDAHDDMQAGSGEFDLSALIDDSLMGGYLDSPDPSAGGEGLATTAAAAATGKKRKSPEAESQASSPAVKTERGPDAAVTAAKPHKFGRTRVEDGD